MTIICHPLQSRHLSGGRKRQTLSTTKHVLLQATVKLPEIKAIPQPVGAPRYLAPSLPIKSICWGHSLFLLLWLRRSLQVVMAGLMDTETISSMS